METIQADTIHGITAEFTNSEILKAAARKVRDSGYKKTDAYTPFPLEGLAESLGVRDKWVPFIMLMAGFIGAVSGYTLAVWAMGISLPLNIAGKPTNSWPLFIPPTFEMTILTSAIVGVVSMFILNGLPMPYHPMFNAQNFDRASTDRFFLTIEAEDALFDKDGTWAFMNTLGADNVSMVEK
ncbi:MAG: DUF3341 domain-containing protein [Abditibacteriaceae bacterium]